MGERYRATHREWVIGDQEAGSNAKVIRAEKLAKSGRTTSRMRGKAAEVDDMIQSLRYFLAPQLDECAFSKSTM